jgi:hypothetical protein
MPYALAARVVSATPRLTIHTVHLTVESRERVDAVLELLTAVAAANSDLATATELADEVLRADHGIEFPLDGLDAKVQFNGPYVEAPGIAAELDHGETSALRDLIELSQRVENAKIALELV